MSSSKGSPIRRLELFQKDAANPVSDFTNREIERLSS